MSTFPAYYKNHDASAFVCILSNDSYMEVRRLHVSHQISFGQNPAIKEMCEKVYVPATEEDFKRKFCKEAANMAKMFDNINH